MVGLCFWWEWVLPRYTITKIYKNSWGQKLHFYDFSNCVFSYSPCISCWLLPTKTIVFKRLVPLIFWRIHPPHLSKNKTTQSGGYIFWWEWVDSNHLSHKTTDLQSAPALQLRRTPRTTLGLFSPKR